MSESERKQQDAEHEYGHRANDGIKVTTAYGTIQAHGPMVIAALLVVCAVAVLAFMQRDHDMRTLETLNRMADIRSAQMAALAEQQQRAEKKMDNLIYVTLLPDNRKAQIQLNMPTDLRMQLLNQERSR